MKLLFATRNRGKLTELKRLLALDGVTLLCLDDIAMPEIEESGLTFRDNALLKARGAMQATGLAALADDSGLEVDALDGQPGVWSARYAGPGASDADRIQLLLDNLKGVPEEQRTARFRCVVAFVHPDDPSTPCLREGCCEGVILQRAAGQGGFGYDPVFYAPALGCTFAQASAEDKNRVSHRGKAMAAIRADLQRCIATHAARSSTD